MLSDKNRSDNSHKTNYSTIHQRIGRYSCRTTTERKNEAIVSMPKIGVDETAKGKVFCDVKDKFGTIYTVSYEVESKWSTIYCATPNPANSVITITKLTDGPDNGLNLCAVNYVTARLYNGQSLVREQEISENCNHIDVEDLPEGSYYLNVEEMVR